MRRVAAILSLVVATTAGAQSFEGAVTYQMEKGTWLYSAKGSKVRMDVNQPEEPGAAMIWDTDANTMMMILPAQKMYMSMPMNQKLSNVPDTAGRGTVTKIGSEVIAGHPCDDYQAVDAHGAKQGVACIAHGMGDFVWFRANSPMMKRMGSRISGLSGAMAGGGFPLKFVDAEGKTNLLATKIERKSIDPSIFTPPAGFTQMQMPAGMQPH
jgi:hypothetical protein